MLYKPGGVLSALSTRREQTRSALAQISKHAQWVSSPPGAQLLLLGQELWDNRLGFQFGFLSESVYRRPSLSQTKCKFFSLSYEGPGGWTGLSY